MKIIDLSHTIHEDMPVFPGTASPLLTPANTYEQDGFCETMLQMVSHTGTHMDAPCHILPGAKSLDQLEVSQFFGMALIIDFPPCAGNIIEAAHLEQMEEKIARAEFVLLHTRHSQKWGSPEYFSGYTTLSPAAAAYLAQFELKGVGVDAISVDTADSSDFAVHRALLGKGMVIIENLCNFSEVKGEYCMFSALPLKYRQADGSPIRAVAIEMETSISPRP